jgi:ubiquinone/menaquinone biosynthesis C-methylase UbiE
MYESFFGVESPTPVKRRFSLDTCAVSLRLHLLNKDKKKIKPYHINNIEKVDKYVSIKDKEILVVGCSTGVDCRLFVQYGARHVDGIDVSDKIGNDFRHRKVKYYKISAEKMVGIDDAKYDIVYCLATLEHVNNIFTALKEMVRVTKPNGLIYTFSAPLWNSSQGHHKANFFNEYPWIHLRLSMDEIIGYCYDNNIRETGDILSIQEHVEYMLNPKYFNKLRSTHYIDVCNQLRSIKIIRNDLVYEESNLLTNEIYDELKKLGFHKKELLAKGHIFIALKI